MLFSEPKIPQFIREHVETYLWIGFSALQRAENSSIMRAGIDVFYVNSFSALQRAENSSIVIFVRSATPPSSFSALQRAENSSIPPDARLSYFSVQVSVLFSEPKIPQFASS